MLPVVKAEVGATAKANLDIKGEISTTAFDRLANAFADAISPFTEKQGLKGDLLRMQRAELSVSVCGAAQQMIAATGAKPGRVPNKVLVPLLEKASLEEPESEMLKRWAALLAAASTTFDLQHPIFADILSRISEREVKFLNKIMDRTLDLSNAQFSLEQAVYYDIFQEMSKLSEQENAVVSRNLLDAKARKIANDLYVSCSQQLLSSFVKKLQECGCIVSSLRCKLLGFNFKEYSDAFGLDASDYNARLDVLTSVGLLKRESFTMPVPTDAIGEFTLSIDLVRLTDIGKLMLTAFSTFHS